MVCITNTIIVNLFSLFNFSISNVFVLLILSNTFNFSVYIRYIVIYQFNVYLPDKALLEDWSCGFSLSTLVSSNKKNIKIILKFEKYGTRIDNGRYYGMRIPWKSLLLKQFKQLGNIIIYILLFIAFYSKTTHYLGFEHV